MKKQKSAPVRDPLADAKFAYFSTCCNAVAKKAPCVAANKITQAHLGAKPEAEGTLGSWRCSACNKPCSCTRTARTVLERREEASNEVTVS
jgi:hypothetical protein